MNRLFCPGSLLLGYDVLHTCVTVTLTLLLRQARHDVLWFSFPYVLFLLLYSFCLSTIGKGRKGKGLGRGWEGAEEEPGDGNNNFVVPAGVPEWVTMLRLLSLHYYFKVTQNLHACPSKQIRTRAVSQ